MFAINALHRALTVLALSAALAAPATADDVRNVKRGEPAPAYRLPAIDGTIIDSTALQGSVVVVVCLSASQRRSELAAMDSSAVMAGYAPDKVRFIHVTADVIEKPYFEKFRADRSISLPLAFDADRDWYARLGLVVFPTTLVIDKDGKLAQVISLHSNAYKHTLTAYIDRALGTIDDKELEKRLAEQVSSESSPRSHASALRALARSMREKGPPEEAKAELNKALEQEPENREVMLDLAELDLQIKDLDGADAMADKVLAAQPDHRRARQIKGIILFYRDKLDESKVMLEDALTLNPSPETAHYYLGRICEKKGDQAGALDHYREALRRYIHEPSIPSASAPADQKPAK